MGAFRVALFGAAVAGCLASPSVQAQDTEAWSHVESSVRDALAARWSVPAPQLVLEWGAHGSLDFADGMPDPELVGNGRAGHWLVRLESTRGVVGVRLRAGVLANTPVAARELQRGAEISAADVRYESRTTWGAPKTGEAPRSTPIGWVAQRRIPEGDVLAAPAAVEPPVVRSGDTVEVSWSTGAVRLSLMGRAMRSARPGEPLSVRLETGKRVQGVATADGSVRVVGLAPLNHSPTGDRYV